MGSLCLSSASILRCDSLTRIQNIGLIIPPSLEILFSISLAFIDRGPRNRNLLLVAEGSSFFILAFLELFAQILPTIRGSLLLFKVFDFIIGISSSLPVSLYTIFLYLLTKAEIVSALPRRIKRIAALALALFIPSIVTFNEIASFIGVSIRKIAVGDQGTDTVVDIGFSSSAHEEIWTFFTSLTLALLIGFQAAVFCFSFFRLTQAILDQRRIECQSGDEVNLIKGIGWVAGSLMLGVAETLVGFAGGQFGVAITRRILRLLARASLYIGVAKGVDIAEDPRALSNDPSTAGFATFRRSDFISNPILDTHQLSPKTTTTHTAQRGFYIHEMSGPHQTIEAENSSQRVTAQYDRDTPLSQMRFSRLDLPSPETLVEEVKSRPQSKWSSHPFGPRSSFQQASQSVLRDSSNSSFSGTFELVTTPRRMLSQRLAQAHLYQAVASGALSPEEPSDSDPVQSMSIPDTLQAVRDLADQFPATPDPMAYKDPNILIERSRIPEKVPIEVRTMSRALGSSSEFKIEESPRKGMLALESRWSNNHPFRMVIPENWNSRSSKQPTLHLVGSPPRSAHWYSERAIDPFNDDDDDARSPYTSHDKMSGATAPGFRQVDSLRDKGATDLKTVLDSGQSRSQKPQLPRQESLRKNDERVARNADWSNSKFTATKIPQADIFTKPLQQKLSDEKDIPRGAIQFAGVKSIGKAPGRPTPLPPGQASASRGGTKLKPILIPPNSGNMPPIIVDKDEPYGSLESASL